MNKISKTKVLAITGVLGLGALALGAGTLAYFTDNDSATNTFTVGNVSIDLIESQLHRVNAGVQNGNTSTSPLWTPNQTMAGTEENTPSKETAAWTGQYFSDEQIEEDAEHYKDTDGYFETNSKNMVPGSSVRKAPYVKNTGKSDAYVRVRVLMPVTLFDVLDRGEPASMWTTTAVGRGDGTELASDAVTYYFANGGDMTNAPATMRTTRNNVEYYVFDFTYKDILESGAITFWNAWGNIAIDKDATSEELANVESFDVIFEADAIQATGFADATAAFAAFDA